MPTENRSKPSPEWNHYRIECNNGAIRLDVNGKVVTTFRGIPVRTCDAILNNEAQVT